MRLADYSLHAYRLRYARPVQWSDIVEEAAPFVLLRLTSDSGEEGVAEVTVKPTWGGVTARSLIATIEDIFMPLFRTLDLSDPHRGAARARSDSGKSRRQGAGRQCLLGSEGGATRDGRSGNIGAGRPCRSCPGR